MIFKMTVEHEVTFEEANAAADEVERAVGEICNGKRKPGSIPMQELCSLVQFARADAAERELAELKRVIAEAQPVQAGAVVPDNVLTFLHGQGPLDGVWFGEPHPIYQGKFWWRAFLPEAPKMEDKQ